MRAAAGRESVAPWWPPTTSCWRRAWWKRARTAASSCARAAASRCSRRPAGQCRPADLGRRLPRASRRRADRRDGADPRHVPQGQRQAAARHGRVSARLAGVDLHAGGGAQGDQHPGAAGVLAAIRRARWATAACAAALSNKLATHERACRAGKIITTVGATHALDIVSRTLLRAGRPGDGRGARLGGGVRAARRRWACACCRCRAGPTGRTWR